MKLIVNTKGRSPDHPVNQPVIILRPKGMPLVPELEEEPAPKEDEE